MAGALGPAGAMHTRNRYNTRPDFGELSDAHPPLKQFLIKKSRSLKRSRDSEAISHDTETIPTSEGKFKYTLDFSSSRALCELSKAILKRDFNLEVDLPLNKLIPAIPQRLNYIHWLEDLCGFEEQATNEITGIDIGTGASCIYPLLGTSLHCNWRFLATEIDAESAATARSNVSRNKLEEKIKVIEVSPAVVLDGILDPTITPYSFTMCNPPFFRDLEEKLGTAESGRPPAGTCSTASDSEAFTSGGEREFVERIVQDSLKLTHRVRWYTSMLGKKASLKPLIASLTKHQVPVVTTTVFVQGHTMRWGLAWSYDTSLKDKAEQLARADRKRRDRGVCLQLPLAQLQDEQIARDWVLDQLDQLQIQYSEECADSGFVLNCRADKNTWSNVRRRRRIRERLENQKQELKGPNNQEQLEALEKTAASELDKLLVACGLSFICRICFGTLEQSPGKKRRIGPSTSTSDVESESGHYLELESLCSEDKDNLHQILQYLNNHLAR